MTENNTTIAECVADCVEAASSSLFDDIEMVIVAGGALLGLASWAYMKYKAITADGEVTLDELMDAAKEGKDKMEEAEEHFVVIEKVYSEYKVAELKTMLKEKGLSTGGVKAELIARLEAHE